MRPDTDMPDTDMPDTDVQARRDGTMLFALLAVAALMPWPLLLGPDNWWAFILVTAAILGVLRLVFGRQWRRRAGLALSPAQALMSVLAFAAVAVGSALLLPILYAAAGMKADTASLAGQVGFLFQAFNEEILFRALLIGFLLLFMRSAIWVSLGVAFVFAAAHFLMYRVTNPLHFSLSPGALATLFLAGVAMNNLYLAFRHIGFSWALHAGWNVVWLPAAFHDVSSGKPLVEPQIFDRVLGSPVMLAVAGAAAVLGFVLLARRAPVGNQGHAG